MCQKIILSHNTRTVQWYLPFIDMNNTLEFTTLVFPSQDQKNHLIQKDKKGICCSLFLVLGVLGNLATCLVIIKNEYMRTTTNIYLFNLALADLGTLVLAMPAELYLMWRQYPWTFGEVSSDISKSLLFVGCTIFHTT